MDCARFHALVPDSFCGTHPCCRGCANSRTDADRVDGTYGQMCHRHPYPGLPPRPLRLSAGKAKPGDGDWRARMWVHLK